MTRRRRLRTRTLVLVSLAATIVAAAALPAFAGTPDLEATLRSWDAVISDGRAGQTLPEQVIVVLAAPPAVDVDSPDASKIAGSAQQLDLDAIARAGIWMKIQYRYVNALNAVSATVRPDQLAQLRATPEVAGVYPVRRVYPAGTVAKHLRSLGASARPIVAGKGADGHGVTVALLDGPVDASLPYLHQSRAGWDAVTGKPGDPNPGPLAAQHGTAMAGIIVGSGGPDGLHGVAPKATLIPIQVLEQQHGALIGTTATLLAGIDRALDPNGDGNLSDHADVIVAPLAEPFAGFGASAENVAAAGVEKAGAVLVAAAGNDGATQARFGTIASPAASPGWLAVGATDGRSKLTTVSVSFTSGGSDTTTDDAPVLGALTPEGGAPTPLALPSGPTRSDPSRPPADIALGTAEDDFRRPDGRSRVRGRAVLLPRDGASIEQRAAAASAAGASALVLYGDGGAPSGALGLDDRVKIPIVLVPGEQGANAAATLLTGGSVHVVFGYANSDSNPAAGSVAPFSSTGLAFDDSVKPDLVAPGVAITTSAAGGGYQTESGTSVAAAQVAGTAAIVRQKHPAWSPALVRGALVGTATAVGSGSGDAPAPVEAQGGGAVDVNAAESAALVAEPTSLSFGLARADKVSATRNLTLANTSSSTLHLSFSLSRDDAGADGASVSLAGAPAGLSIAPGATTQVKLTLKARSLPDRTTVVGGWVLVATGAGQTVRVPWAISRSTDLAAGLIANATISPVRVQPTPGDGSVVARLSLVVGSATSSGSARLVLTPVQRLSVDLYHGSRLLGRLVERHELLPGSYRYAFTGVDPSTDKPLKPGVYRLVIDAVSADDVTSEQQLGFTVA